MYLHRCCCRYWHFVATGNAVDECSHDAAVDERSHVDAVVGNERLPASYLSGVVVVGFGDL